MIPTKREIYAIVERDLGIELSDRLTMDEISSLASTIIDSMTSELDFFEDEDDEEDEFKVIDD